MLGKRKRDSTVAQREKRKEESDTIASANSRAQELLRKYFESKFQPLEPLSQPASAAQEASDTSSTDSDGETDWDGISEGSEGEQAPEVVDHSGSKPSDDLADKQAHKQFMSAKPPSSSQTTKSAKSNPSSKGDEEDESMDAANLKNDMALQRLLKESHLLESAEDLNPTGRNRHKALDLRMQDLGAKTSLFNQAKMPMSHRKGINTKAVTREETRRREARENGIILEKPTAPKNQKPVRKRERGIGAPGIGKFVGGTLRLSKSDVHSIQGPKRSGSSRGKSRRGGGGGRIRI
ncbi:hypothetical protein AJ80_02539 [Polytolypa hystricis UAMH7299]|uniref:Protein FAF1 n=1 Tax=Polytolypa hystricis (strain UAMH7299) TaxID=1447883 RepID=A0A2B7YQX5_POLH7|nr:hypothetical protein AJ80_02539 [Polytolypa hystricis UAMH7299]